MTDLRAYLDRVPLLCGGEVDVVRRLAGLTNINHLIEHDGHRYVVRIPGAGTGEYINRDHEQVAALASAAVGVNAPVLFFDPNDGLMVTAYIEGAVTMDADRFTDLGAVARAGQVLQRLHAGSLPFASEFGLFSMIDDYKRLLATKGAVLPDGYSELERLADATRRALEANPRPLVPSHCDPLCANFLDTGNRMYLIDYEYAGNHDPMWDLADLSVEGAFGADQDHVLLSAYVGSTPHPNEVGRMMAYKAMCDLLWTLWGVIQHVNGNAAEDFWAYSVGRFERCRALMATANYSGHLAAIAGE